MGCRIYLVRHGETSWNVKLKFQGHTDVPLAQRGIEQANFLARRLNKMKFAAIYSSDLKRAMETAEILAMPHGITVQSVPKLREANFGRWEGMNFKEIREEYAITLQQWWDNPKKTAAPGGETLEEMALRVNGAVREIAGRHMDEQEVVIVAHGGPIRAVICNLLGMDLNYYRRLQTENTSLNIINFSSLDNGHLVLFNDCRHLECFGNK